jgi:hypothetical protein
MPPLWCHRLELPRSSTYAAGAAVLMATLVDQTSLPWPDESRKIERAEKPEGTYIRHPPLNARALASNNRGLEFINSIFTRRPQGSFAAANFQFSKSPKREVHDVEQVVVFPRLHLMQTSTH